MAEGVQAGNNSPRYDKIKRTVKKVKGKKEAWILNLLFGHSRCFGFVG